ncbi:dephospho-CoA kinase domain-containing protein-like [Mercenaria mercenaria]|uniref:dephospho-CoA kinase domain-containing protein-like n=1 Tax=Mercenaria mercenaria TaxID=6596 RepID=UPI00234F08B8|nr:dephospho-CoA kinase domain-containing protein-like [Mercenaria mercenaria]
MQEKLVSYPLYPLKHCRNILVLSYLSLSNSYGYSFLRTQSTFTFILEFINFTKSTMFIIGLTGGISTGKSTVSQMFKELGCPIVDADVIAREVVEPGTKGWEKIRKTFGEDVFHDDGHLNREKLGQLIFADSDKRVALNKITHPEIQKVMMWKLFMLFAKGHQFAILDTPLLFESNKMVPYMAYTIVISCTPEQQLSRLQARNKLSEDDAMQRINSQMSLDEKCRLATFVIDNSGDIANTRQQVLEIHKKLCSSRRHWKLRIVLLSVIIVFVSVIGYLVAR